MKIKGTEKLPCISFLSQISSLESYRRPWKSQFFDFFLTFFLKFFDFSILCSQICFYAQSKLQMCENLLQEWLRPIFTQKVMILGNVVFLRTGSDILSPQTFSKAVDRV